MKYCDAKIASLAPQRYAATSVLCATSQHQNNCDTQTFTMHSIWSWTSKHTHCMQTLHFWNCKFAFLNSEHGDCNRHWKSYHCTALLTSINNSTYTRPNIHSNINSASFNLPSHTASYVRRRAQFFFVWSATFFQNVGAWMNPISLKYLTFFDLLSQTNHNSSVNVNVTCGNVWY